MVKLIVAIGENNAIGKDNDLIWHLPADMKFFSDTTKSQIVLMGRRNWHSIPLKYRPLPNRLNLVATHDTTFKEEGCEVFYSIEEAIKAYKTDERDFFVIGGGQIYNHALQHGLIDEMYVTKIDQAFEADTFFPEIDTDIWIEEKQFHYTKDEKNEYSFTVFKYIKK